MKKIASVISLFLTPIFIFILLISIVVTVFMGSNKKYYDEYVNSYCSIASIDESTIENQNLLYYFKDNLYENEWSKIGVALVEYGNDKETTLNQLNKLSNYVQEKGLMLHENAIIQYTHYGLNYIDYVTSMNKYEIDDFFNTTYEINNLLENKNSKYYLDVLSNANMDCEFIEGGLPVDTDNVDIIISGWYPTYDGSTNGATHSGIDLSLAYGTPIYAVDEGEVLRIHNGEENNNIVEKVGLYGAGNVVVIQSKDKVILYAHLTNGVVMTGQKIKKGQLIGFSGSSGMSTGGHLHIEITGNSNLWENAWGSVARTHNPCKIISDLCK